MTSRNRTRFDRASRPTRGTTALVASLALALPPLPAFAQEMTPRQAREACEASDLDPGAGRLRYCVERFLDGEDGVALAKDPANAAAALEALAAAQVAGGEDGEGGAIDGGDQAELDEDGLVEGESEADVAVEVEAEAPEGDVAVEVEPAENAERDEGVTLEAEAEAEPDADASADGAGAAQAEAAPAPQDGDAAEAPADGAEVLSDSDVTPETETVETEGDAADAGDAQAGETSSTTAEAEGEGTVETDTETESETGTNAAAETADPAPAPAAPESEVAAEIAAQPEPELSPEQERARDQAQAALSALNSALGGDAAVDDASDGAAQPAAPAAAAAAAEDGTDDAAASDGDVVEEVVAEEDVRRSSEDFATDAVVTEAAPSGQADDDDGGLSNREKFALGALGALAVGTILNNRTRVVSNSGDRVVVQQDDGNLQVLKDDDALLRQAGSRVRTRTFDDGSTRTIVTREDGSQVITVRDASLRVLRRVLVEPDGSEYVLIDDTQPAQPVEVSTLPETRPTLETGAAARQGDDSALRAALAREAGLDRRFTLAQVRQIPEVRRLAPAFEVNSVTFPSGSAAIQPDQADELTALAQQMVSAIRDNPREVFLIEGHTDAVGDAAYNLALSDRRAESLALALNEYFGVPVENMVVQGYGERFLKVPTQAAEQANRRAVARQITGLLQTAAAN